MPDEMRRMGLVGDAMGLGLALALAPGVASGAGAASWTGEPEVSPGALPSLGLAAPSMARALSR
eukprot:3933637-Rhodomonas_salina.2